MNARVRAPAWPASLEWINTDQSPSLESLRGRVMLMHFWTFDCVNCVNSLPDLRYLENKYHDGLSVVGVHSPKYDYQRQGAAVLKAVNRGHVRHPVANDCNFEMWQAYGVQAWPTMAVIDAEGQLAALLPGEGRRQETDALIGQLLDEAASKDQRVYETPAPVGRPEARCRCCFRAGCWPPIRACGFPTAAITACSNAITTDASCASSVRAILVIGTAPTRMPDLPIRRVWPRQGLAVCRRYRQPCGAPHPPAQRRSGNGRGHRRSGYELPNDDVDPVRVAMSAPTAIAGAGEKVYFVLSGQNQLWQLDLIKNRLSVLAGNGQLGLTDGDGLSASFAQPNGISLIGQQLVICERLHRRCASCACSTTTCRR